MLGAEQEKWPNAEFQVSRAQWNILANQVRMTDVDIMAGAGTMYAMDNWSGYDGARRRLMTGLAERRVHNPVVITGDIHNNWVGDLKLDYGEEKSAIIASELVGTSISTGGDGADSSPQVEAYLRENPQIKFFNNQRGYVKCDVTPKALTAEFRVVTRVSTPESPITTRARFVIEDGQPGAHQLT